MPGQDAAEQLQAQVRSAIAGLRALRIQGSGSKAVYGHPVEGEALSTLAHHGIVDYQPSELVISARAGTPLREVQAALDQHRQQLAFEPPWFGEHATLGGTIACGLSGPGRVAYGSARDFVLGTRILNGHGEVLRFGGEVMKNVAGYDVSRLMTGALGSLGVIMEVSLKTLPQAECVRHLRFEMDTQQALEQVNRWAGQPRPISASCIDADGLQLRLSGNTEEVRQCQRELGGEAVDLPDFWLDLREQRLPFFDSGQPLWRLSVPPATPVLDLPGDTLYEWHGGLRWLLSEAPATVIRDNVAAHGGHATLFRSQGLSDSVFQPLSNGLMALHRQLKQAFDPHGLFNPGRLYPEL